MRRRSWRARSLAFVALVASSCAAPPASLSVQDTGTIQPLEHSGADGRLIVIVLGTPRDIEYAVNGVRIQADQEIAWWKDARLDLRLRPGRYKLQATYRARAFAGDKTLYRIASPEPVDVQAGETTYVAAKILKDWRGAPDRTVTDFAAVTASEFAVLAASVADVPAASPQTVTATLATTGSVAVSDPAAPEAAPTIVIRGATILPADGSALPDSTESALDSPPAAALGLPDSAPPPAQDLLAPSGRPTIAMQLASEPSGARVVVDENAVGTTPLEIRVDPTQDHVVRFELDGCSDHVRLLSAAGWEQGRSSKLSIRLECP